VGASSSGLWNWTCSAFSAITAASTLAAGSVILSPGILCTANVYPHSLVMNSVFAKIGRTFPVQVGKKFLWGCTVVKDVTASGNLLCRFTT